MLSAYERTACTFYHSIGVIDVKASVQARGLGTHIRSCCFCDRNAYCLKEVSRRKAGSICSRWNDYPPRIVTKLLLPCLSGRNQLTTPFDDHHAGDVIIVCTQRFPAIAAAHKHEYREWVIDLLTGPCQFTRDSAVKLAAILLGVGEVDTRFAELPSQFSQELHSLLEAEYY